jgi:hypothetical protein
MARAIALNISLRITFSLAGAARRETCLQKYKWYLLCVEASPTGRFINLVIY